MAQQGTVLVGTVGQGVMSSRDDGATWTRASTGQGMHSDAMVRCLAAEPNRPEVIYAGTDQGLYQSEDGGARWRLLDTPMSGSAVWNVAIDQADPNVRFAGTGTPSVPRIYRSTNAGQSWQQCQMEIAETCPAVGIPRPTAIVIDPTNSRNIWVGLEVDGVRRSTDGGDTWTKLNGAIANPDVHSMVVTAGPPHTVFTVVNNDVWRSVDNGTTWESAHVRESFPWHYPRSIAVKPSDPKTVFVAIGDATPGRIGTIMRSKDAGATWENLAFPVQPNSAMWALAIPAAEPDLMFAATRYGYLYRSDDGGDSWRKLWRELSEVSSVLWVTR
jgi:photosystem II stability/assembly factor-like uncharacterized protein